MGRLLLLLVLAFVAAALLRAFIVYRNRNRAAQQKEQNSQTQRTDTPTELLPCPQCGVHLPANELAQHQTAQHPQVPPQ